MKNLLLIMMMLVSTMALYAQNEVTKFLGIPVDGSESEMVRKLKEKGFRNSSTDGMLEGEFNGSDVYIAILTNNRKVWRVAVVDQTPRDETQIKIRFNRLCQQFENNGNYLSSTDQTLSDTEDIGYGIMVEKKQYAAVFYQKPITDMMQRMVWFTIASDPLDNYRIWIYYDNLYNQANGEDL